MQNLKKYDGKQDPKQWLRIYSTAIEVAGVTNSNKVIYFPMALESAPLTWLESLRLDSIHSWEDLKKIFIDNFQGCIHRPATRHDLHLCKQERGEALRSYIKRFFDTRATIANITDDDVIGCFHNGLATQQLYRDFREEQAPFSCRTARHDAWVGLSGRKRTRSFSPLRR